MELRVPSISGLLLLLRHVFRVFLLLLFERGKIRLWVVGENDGAKGGGCLLFFLVKRRIRLLGTKKGLGWRIG